MAGPCSLPNGDKRRWEELNMIVCDVHFKCDMDPDKTHDYITYREWLARRNRLRTGKTV
jgi:hypothetical protein